MTKINSKHKDFLTGNICDTTNVSIKEEIAKEYSQEVIDLAIQLKANNLEGAGGARDENKYTAKPLKGELDAYDTTFVTIAKNIIYREFCGKFDAIYKNVAMNCDITDPEWAIYSAEEILDMEQNGTVIPKDVIEWAHSQQQLDATNDTLSTTSDSEDATVADNLSDTDALAVLQATAKKNIEKVEKASEKIEEKQEKYDEISAKAAQVKNKKEDDFNKKVEEVEGWKKEWEELNSKKENGGLSFIEKQKYNKLSKQLQNTDSEFTREMNFGSSELDEFLDELDVINNEISTNTQVAKDAIDAGKALNDLDRNYNDETLPYAYTGTTLDNSGLISDELSGLTNEDIGEQAIKKGGDLEADTNTLEESVNSADNVETEEFAVNYTGYVQESKDETENVKEEANVDETENTAETENSKETKKEEEKEETSRTKEAEQEVKKLEYGSKSAIKATAKTLLSSGKDVVQGIGVSKDDKALNKELKTTSRAMDRINKEVEKVTERLTDNETNTEKFIQELEQLQAENPEDGDVQISAATGSEEAATQNDNAEQTAASGTSAVQNQQQNTAGSEETPAGIIVKDENSEFSKAVEKSNIILGAFDAADEIVAGEKQKQAAGNQDNVENPEEAAKKAENRAKKVEVAEKIQDLGSDKEAIANDLEAANEKGDAATKKGIKLLGTLNKSNAKLDTQNEKTSQDASDAVDIGVGTFELGTGHTLEGFGLMAYGATLMSNPFTFNTGVIISALGQKTLSKGQKEIVTGLVSTAAGMASKGIVSEENSVISDSVGTMTKAQSILNVNVLNLTQSENQAQDAEKSTGENTEVQSAGTATEETAAEGTAAEGIEAAETETAGTEAAEATTAGAETQTTSINAEAPKAEATPVQQEVLTGFAAPVEDISAQKTQSTKLNPQETAHSEAQTTNNNNVQEDTQTAPLTRAAETSADNNTAKIAAQNETNSNQAEKTEAADNKENNVTAAETSSNDKNKATETATEEALINTAKENAEKAEETAQTTENNSKEETSEEIKKNTSDNTTGKTQEQANSNASVENTETIDATQETQNSEKSESDKKSDANDKKEVSEKDAETASKDAKKNAQDMKTAQKEDKQNNKEFKKTSKQVKDINKSAKNDEKKFQKQMQTEQKQIEKKQQEIEKTNAEITEKEAKLTETQTNQEALMAALSSATPSKQAELQPQIQSNAVTLTDKSAEIAALKANVNTTTTIVTKKVQNLRKVSTKFVSTMKAKSKTSQNANKTADKILKIADTTSQIAGLASIAGSITSRIGNALTAAGTAQVTAGTNLIVGLYTPMLSNPFTAAAGAAGISTTTATMVVPGTAQIATGTTTSIVGESVSLAANITNAAASATKAVIYAEQGNIAGAIMATGSAIMSGVSAGQNISQLGQLNKMADAASTVSSAAQQASTTAQTATQSTAFNSMNNMSLNGTTTLGNAQKSIQSTMSKAMDGTMSFNNGQFVQQAGFKSISQNFAKANKFGLDDVMQIGGALQTAGSLVASKNDGKTEVTKKRRMQRFGQIARLDVKRRNRRVNAASASANYSGSSGNNSSRQ